MKVWVDTDIALGAGTWRGDVDDAFALAAVCAAANIDLIGVSAIFGNTSEETARSCASQLLEVAERDIDVARGAVLPGQRSPAADQIAALPSGAWLLCLGPLTNLAAALAIDPSLAERIGVSIVGGNLSSWGRLPPFWPFEFNLAKDPPATEKVFRAPALKRRLYPLDVCRHLMAGPVDILRLGFESRLGRYLSDLSLRWLAYTPLRYRSWRFPVWDLVPALDVIMGFSAPVAPKRLAAFGRGGLEETSKALETDCVTATVDQGWSHFRALLRDGG